MSAMPRARPGASAVLILVLLGSPLFAEAGGGGTLEASGSASVYAKLDYPETPDGIDGRPDFAAIFESELAVACVFSTDDGEFDASTAFIDIDTAAELLGTRGTAELWLRLYDPNTAEALRDSQLAYLKSRDCVARTWSELQGSMLVMLKLSDLFILIIDIIVLIVAATVITNAILMNVFEKRREYGTLRAIGLRRRQQSFLILAEGGGQGLVGAVLGVALAMPLVLYLQRHGLAIGEASHVFGGGDLMYFGLDPVATLENMGFGVLIALVGSLYAAIVGTRSSVVDALKNA